MTATVLIIDDDSGVLRALSRLVGEEYDVVTASSGEEAFGVIEDDPPDVILTDLQLPGMDGLEILGRLREDGHKIPAIMISGAGTVETAVQAVRSGAYDFVEKPVKKERLMTLLTQCLRFVRLEQAHDALRSDVVEHEILGESAPMLTLKKMIDKVAPSDGRVLILGENGTGKELVAAAIHAGSARRDKPFVKLNCSAVPRDLVESELFGHEKGAFTGAVKARRGRFEMADGGTLFLDEIGDMPPEMQVKLLRVLQESEFERVGGSKTIRVDVRVLAATNRDLGQMVNDGEFREDLYYRLNVVTLRTPPLRERVGDVPLLADYFTKKTAARNRQSRLGLSDAAKQVLARYPFPGNVRQLQNLIEGLGILADGDTITEDDVALALNQPGPKAEQSRLYQPGERLADLVREAERRIIAEAIEAHEGNKAAAARALNVERAHFYKKCKALGITDSDS